MKQVLLLSILAILCSCDDGNLFIETIDFDSVDIQTCESTVTTESTIFFKINDDEALILTLQNGVLRNEVSEGEIESTIPGQSQLVYRIFSDQVSNSYFCDAVPPIDPMVTEEIEAESGSIFVSTVALDAESFEHTIRLDNVSFVTGTDERITDLRINEFGTVTTN
ncbi:hypothetical protein [Ulvibacterium sp.]|uniref:hypothetical protein n=1 Tax=Ulvibacterium sp. TaxID=2665914 RepID=UPI00261EE1BD|nr:hypothetical protein [Ulvibacterium sp.]